MAWERSIPGSKNSGLLWGRGHPYPALNDPSAGGWVGAHQRSEPPNGPAPPREEEEGAWGGPDLISLAWDSARLPLFWGLALSPVLPGGHLP